ncbi:MAG: leucine-rich repeat domain-containing protein, partial [Clostridia bacterium]|nr:leucine-rich repeat domain-containing protein [Clostridia bacterium]
AVSVNDVQSYYAPFGDAGILGSGITVTFGNEVTRIPKNLFDVSNTGLSIKVVAVIIESGVTSITDNAFQGLTDLTSITIPSSVTSIGVSAFQGCTELTSITIPSSVTSIGDIAFAGCKKLATVNYDAVSVEDFTSNYPEVFNGAGTEVGGVRLIIGEGVQRIPANFLKSSGITSIYYSGDIEDWCGMTFGSDWINNAWTFYIDNAAVTNLTIPDGVTSIADNAFQNCIRLTSITIPNSLNNIGNYAFTYCYMLTEVLNKSSFTISAGSSGYGDVGHYAIVVVNNETLKGTFETASNGVIYYTNANFNIPKTAVGITSQVSESITIANDCVGIKSFAFQGCTGLTNLTIPASVTSIGTSAFNGCSNLTEINYNGSITTDFATDSYLFYEAGQSGEGITLNIGSNVTKVPTCMFYGSNGNAAKITSITINNTSVVIGTNAFAGLPVTSAVVPMTAFTTGGLLKSSLVTLTITSGVVGGSAFSGTNAPNLETVIIKSNVTEIQGWAFTNNRKITSVTIEEGITSIGQQAFYKCTHLTSITIPDSVTSIGDSAFNGCSSLQSAVIGSGVTFIGMHPFYECYSLNSVTFRTLSGWYVTQQYSVTTGTAVDVSNTATTATVIKGTYDDYYWKRNV